MHYQLYSMKKQSLFNLFITSALLTVFATTATAQSGTVTVNADSKIDELLTIKKRLEKENKLDGGYTIQLFYGDLSKAESTLKKYRSTYGSWPASIEYETPNYKIWAGNFSSRIEADRALMEVQKGFPNAFILEKKVK